MLQHIDTDRIRQSVDLVAMAGQLTPLRKIAAREYAGACPKCGGSDRLHVKADWWFCRQCWPAENGKQHDAIAWAMWLYELPFPEACKRLDASALPAPVVREAPVVKQPTPTWADPRWQADAQQEAREAAAKLAGARGEAARSYLASRGLAPETWRAWGLGCGMRWNWHIEGGSDVAAIVLPWRAGDVIRALQYRFYGPGVEKDARFSQRKGGERVLFGLDMLKGGDALLLIEGEFNCLSVWQAALGGSLDVVSFGPEGNAAKVAVKELAARYQRVVVWADEAEHTAKAMAAIPGARGLQSVKIDGAKLDANELLQRGVLADFLAAVLGRNPWSDNVSKIEGL